MNIPDQRRPGVQTKVLDVLRNEIVTYDPASSRGAYTEVPATGAWEARVKQLHTELIEHIAESDDTLLTKYLDQGGLSEEEFRAGIHSAVQGQHFHSAVLPRPGKPKRPEVARLNGFHFQVRLVARGSQTLNRRDWIPITRRAEVRLTDHRNRDQAHVI